MIVSLPRAIFVSGGVCYGDCRRREKERCGEVDRAEQQGIGDKTLQVQYARTVGACIGSKRWWKMEN